ncbi:Ubiquitin carboxyl-terminal hydrolase 10 [Hibiscus syriacus]|uniref:Ubiquitin carboxyl-terminal hydrolase 10 n=1 Tax=Hibiscus syriacus TaxID=106335 RepID=A0A6A2X4M5_HIBSY|nr:Ubiquitin carboxyl-terminal hydrolase 10 [Hibiscus syriacus]
MTIPDSGFMMENGTCSLPCTTEEEKKIITDLENESERNLKPGNLYFVISSSWFRRWERYVGIDPDENLIGNRSSDYRHINGSSSVMAERPGPIDNSDIVENGNDSNCKENEIQLRRMLMEGQDYVLVPQGVWEKLHEWYQGGPALPRKMILQGVLHRKFDVEVYPLCLKLIDSRDESQSTIWISRKASVTELLQKVCALRGIEQDKARLWDYFNKRKYSQLSVSTKSLEESNLQMDQDILLEQVDGRHSSRFGMDSTGNELALVSLEPSRSPLTIAGGSTLSNGRSSGYTTNLYAGSSLSSRLTDMDDGLDAYNSARKGEKGGRTAIAPHVFKGKLSRFAPQFSGYNQQDSQELLAFLLDGLHEDLNRVKQKPYIERKDSDGRPDEEVAAECWKNHKARNDSGQYKSTLVCPVCRKISITFDPFMYLSLPLPSTITRKMTVTVFYGDGSHLPMPFTVSVLKNGFCKDLLLALGAACGLKNDESLMLADVYENKIYRYLEMPLEPLASIKDDEHIVAFRFQKKAMGKTKLVIFHRWQEKSKSDYRVTELYGTPLVTYLAEDQPSGADIETTASRVLSPFIKISSAKAHVRKENGFHSDGPDKQRSHSDAVSVENAEPEGTSSTDLSLLLHLIDDRFMTFKAFKKNTLFESGKILRVVLDWTDKEQELYDASYLKDIPEEHRQAIKKLDLWMLPEIIVFHLKRFTYGRYLKNKIDTFVNFPVHNLDLSKFVTSNDGQAYIYELYAISNHYGGLGGGHYTAYAKLIDENRWYHFDDSHVSAVNESDIKTSAAYLLFYKRVRTESKVEAGNASVIPYLKALDECILQY